MSIAHLVNRMVAAGMSAGEAGDIASAIFAAGAASVPIDTRSPGAKYTAAWRDRERMKAEIEGLKHLLASQNLTKSNAPNVSQNITEPHKTSQSEVLENPPISISKNLKSRERQNRGTRITVDWIPSDADRAFAKQEGFSDLEIEREIGKFRDHWIAEAGSKGVKLDWSATWRKWVRRAAEWAGKAPPAGSNASASLPDSYYAKPDSAQLAAWDAYSVQINGKRLPRDKNQGWRVKSEWPPGYVVLPDHPAGAYQEAGIDG